MHCATVRSLRRGIEAFEPATPACLLRAPDGIFVGYWAGKSEWERHVAGDEIVMVLDGETTIYLFTDDGEAPAALRRSEFTIVPQGTLHRFETSHSGRWKSAPDRRILYACRGFRFTSPTTSTKS